MLVHFRSNGIYLPEIDLALDAESSTNCWISHGHGDHARGLHSRVIATPLTLQAYRMRITEPSGADPLFVPLQYEQPFPFHGAVLTALPASHIAGAAQLLVEYGGERLIYTGDIKLRPPLCGAETRMVPCHRLIIESTFGLPIYRFLSRETARERILDFASETLNAGKSPVFMGYPLGRGQEIAHVLTTAGLPTAVHGAIARYFPLYEQAGYAFPGWLPYANRDTDGKALVVTPEFRNFLEASGKNIRIAYVSGWASLDNARARAGAEVLIPYSDHGDFDELLALVQQSGAREVDVVHGYTEPFARILRMRGVNARGHHAAPAGPVEPQEG